MGALTDKVAWVSGSSRGIGAAIAKLFAKEGAKVAVHGRDAATIAAIVDDIKTVGGLATGVTGDVTSFADVERVRFEVEGRLGPIDILVANAGGNFSPPAVLEDTTEEHWRAAIDGNLTATFLTLKSVLPGMKQRRGGVVITMSSAAARRASAHAPIGYAAAKAAIEILTQDVAAQAGPFNVRVNCIAPETILTERNRQRIPQAQQHELAESRPLKRLGAPEDVADAALFLASEGARWITGIVLDVAGGALMAR
jgi:3-oxoacyl-[acyl-carrier protein] reductase